MGLLSIIKKVKRREREMRLLLVGLDNAGKTTIMKQVSGEDINDISPTLGFNIKTLEFKQYTLNIWDVGGQKTLRSYWRNYFEQTDGLVWVVDSADVRRLQDCAESTFLIHLGLAARDPDVFARELHKLLLEERLAGATLLILANKQDIPGALAPGDIQKVLQLANLGDRHWRIVGCSAVTSAGLQDAFQWIVEDVASRVYMLD